MWTDKEGNILTTCPNEGLYDLSINGSLVYCGVSEEFLTGLVEGLIERKVCIS